MGKAEGAGESQSYPSRCKQCLTCMKGVGEGRKKLKTNISIEKKTKLCNKWRKIKSN